MKTDLSLTFGVVFGFVLSRIGATDPQATVAMFRLSDLHLAFVIVIAIALSAIVFAAFRKGLLQPRSHAAHALVRKPWTRGVVWGGLLFGVGWAVAGACPGTALAQIGEGRLGGVLVLLGVLGGSALAAGLGRATARAQPIETARV
jgi:uncharacterized membrane protein YedE/YeeE